VKKALIITYYWPPSGGGGVQRWLKFAKYMREYGWEPIIFTPENPAFPLQDRSLLKDIPEDLEVIKIPIFEPYRLYSKVTGEKGNIGLIKKKDNNSITERFAKWARANLFIPDPKIFWVKPSVKFLKDYLKNHKVDVIITTGPPHSIHLIALRLKKHIDIPWLADFRDMWSLYDILHHFKPGRRAIVKNTQLELQVYKVAEKVVTITKNTAIDLEELGKREIEVITNGFDENDFRIKEKTSGKFIISHFGLLNTFRNPKLLWDVLEELCVENENFSDSLELRLGGMIDPEVKEDINRKLALSQRTVFYDYLSHKDVIEKYYESSVLLLLLNNTYLGTKFMTGKIFEYLAVNRPIFAIGAIASDASEVLKDTGAGVIKDFQDKDGMKEILTSWFNNKDIPDLDSEKIKKYSRKNLTHNLVDLLESMI